MDPISDMLIRIKNAQRAGHETVQFPYSKFKHELAKALERAGFVHEIERRGKKIKKTLELKFVLKDGEPALRDIKLLSKPSRRLYTSHKEVGRGKRGGVILLTTPRGVMTGEEAKKAKVGGELVAEVF